MRWAKIVNFIFGVAAKRLAVAGETIAKHTEQVGNNSISG